MFIINITYKKSLDDVEKYLAEHRKFLDYGYENKYFLVSGPKCPRNGGVIISQLSDKIQVQDVIKLDPFYVNDIADYDIIEFNPTKFIDGVQSLI